MRPNERGEGDEVVREVSERLSEHTADVMAALELARTERDAECNSIARLHTEMRMIKTQLMELRRETSQGGVDRSPPRSPSTSSPGAHRPVHVHTWSPFNLWGEQGIPRHGGGV